MTKETKGPDNNKRLALLEQGVSALAIALTQNGVDVAEGANVIELAIGRIKLAAELETRVEVLQGEISSLNGHIAGLEQQLEGKGNATDGEIAAIARADKAEARVTELEAALAEAANMDGADAGAALEDRLDALQRELALKDARIAELEAGGSNAGGSKGGNDDQETAEAPPVGRDRPESAGDVGPDYGGLQQSEDLIKLLICGDRTGWELAFSNGEYEIVQLARVPLGPTDLVVEGNRLLVATPVHVKLAAVDVAERIHGAGLLLGGEQIGYCPLLDALTLEPGTERRFDRTFTF